MPIHGGRHHWHANLGSVTPDELFDAVSALRALDSEVTEIEAKSAAGGLPRSIRSTVSAFANTSGGVIILGIDEKAGFATNDVLDPSKMASDLVSMLSEEFEPPVRGLVNPMEFDGCTLVVAEIPALPFDQRPCYYKGAGMSGGSWTRTGASNRKLSAYEVQIMLASRGQPRNDERAVEGTSFDDLDPDTVERLIARMRATRAVAFGGLDNTDLLRRCGVLTEGNSGGQVLTLAGLLALGKFPQQWFPQLNLTFVHYPGDHVAGVEGVRFLDNVAIDGSIPVMVRDAVAAVTRNLARRSVVTGAGRTDVLEYPELVVREAIVNALVHRDLSPAAEGAQVQVELFPNRLVVRNPGGLHGPVTVDQLFEEGISSSRNARLLRLLEDVPISGEDRTVVENRGSGIRVMAQALRAAGMNLPQFENQISRFSVTFPNHTLLSAETVSWIESLEQDGLSDSQIVALATMRSGEALDNPKYRSLTGSDSRVATIELQDLVARELVEQAGERRWARYSMPMRVAQERRRLAPANRRTEILAAMAADTLSAKEISERTRIPVKTVRHWLKRLRDEDKIRFAPGGGAPQSNLTKYEATVPLLDENAMTLFDMQ